MLTDFTISNCPIVETMSPHPLLHLPQKKKEGEKDQRQKEKKIEEGVN